MVACKKKLGIGIKIFLEAKIVGFDAMLNKLEKIKKQMENQKHKKGTQENTTNHVVWS